MPELTFDLWLATASIVAVGYWLASKTLPHGFALAIAAAKALLFLIYFGWFYDASWNILDDFVYLRNGEVMLQQGYTPFSLFTQEGGVDDLVAQVGGEHFLYDWWNMLGQYLLGPNYFSPVALNVMVTFLCGHLLYKTARVCEFDDLYARCLMVFFLFHWEILAWTTLINQKDILVMTMSVAVFYFFLGLVERATVLRVVGLACVAFLFLNIRFYVPFTILMTIILWLGMRASGIGRVALVAGVVLLGIGAWGLISADILDELQWYSYLVSFADLLYGLVHFTLTPQPWALSPEYTFLLIPSTLHMLMFVPMITGGVWLWKASPRATLPIFYLIAGCLFYASVDELQGPRHRFQFTFIIAWLQFHFIWTVLNRSTLRTRLPLPLRLAA